MRIVGGRGHEVRRQHGELAACLVENGWPLPGPPVLGVVLGGPGWGDDSAPDGAFDRPLRGGEFLLADSLGYRRLAELAPVAMPGGRLAVREPWRNLYAHVRAAMGWEAFRYFYGSLPACALLEARPISEIDEMIATGDDAPRAASCARLIDAVAAALGLCDGRQAHDGEAAARLEALAHRASRAPQPYPFALRPADGADDVRRLGATPMWRALFDDLAAGADPADVAASFHAGLAVAVAETAAMLARAERCQTVALAGGCFANRLLLDGAARRLRAAGLTVLMSSQALASDESLPLGRAAVAPLIGEARKA